MKIVWMELCLNGFDNLACFANIMLAKVLTKFLTLLNSLKFAGELAGS